MLADQNTYTQNAYATWNNGDAPKAITADVRASFLVW